MTTEDTEPDIAYVGCASSNYPPAVPSDEVECSQCGTKLWLSHTMRDDLATMHSETEIEYRCAFTCMPSDGEAEVRLSLSQRVVLQAKGLTNDEIDECLRLLNLITTLGADDE